MPAKPRVPCIEEQAREGVFSGIAGELVTVPPSSRRLHALKEQVAFAWPT